MPRSPALTRAAAAASSEMPVAADTSQSVSRPGAPANPIHSVGSRPPPEGVVPANRTSRPVGLSTPGRSSLTRYTCDAPVGCTFTRNPQPLRYDSSPSDGTIGAAGEAPWRTSSQNTTGLVVGKTGDAAGVLLLCELSALGAVRPRQTNS